jgi:hypothetical protein
MNGFKDSAWKEMDKIEVVELVLEDFGHMGVFNRFKGLRMLTLINCGIASIDVPLPLPRASTNQANLKRFG